MAGGGAGPRDGVCVCRPGVLVPVLRAFALQRAPGEKAGPEERLGNDAHAFMGGSDRGAATGRPPGVLERMEKTAHPLTRTNIQPPWTGPTTSPCLAYWC